MMNRLPVKASKISRRVPALELLSCLNSAKSAAVFMNENPVDLVFLDIQMPGVNGMEFAKSIPKTTLVIFITAFTEYALDSYEVDAVSYLVKPIEPAKFRKAVEKAIAYHSLLLDEEEKVVKNIGDEYIFVKSDRCYFKVNLKDILFVEGLKEKIVPLCRLLSGQLKFKTNDFYRKNKTVKRATPITAKKNSGSVRY
jgi:DNA-binding LytR/AlgR family response regulator